jgi:hypothetical protein
MLPPLRRLLRTAPVGAGDLLVIGVCAAAPALARELIKRFHAQPRAADRAPTPV